MLEQQALVSRLVDEHLHSIQSLRDLGSAFADKITGLLTEHDDHIHHFVTSQKTLTEAKLSFIHRQSAFTLVLQLF